MRIALRSLLSGAAGVCAVAAAPRLVLAAEYPTKPIRMVVGFPPGGSADFIARVIGEALGKRLGQPIIIENKPGAVAEIAQDYTAKAAPDGYTIILGSSGSTSMLAAERHLPYDIINDFTYLMRVVDVGFAIVANPNLPVKTLPELIAYAKERPGKLKCGTIGIGSASHLAMLLLEQRAGFSVTTVPYKADSGILPDLISGILDIAVMTVPDSAENAKSGKLRMLAVTSPTREPLVADVPALAESGYPNATVTTWMGLMGPARLPENVQARLISAATDALNDPAVQQRLVNLSLRPAPLAPEPFRNAVVEEARQWKSVVDAAHLVIN